MGPPDLEPGVEPLLREVPKLEHICGRERSGARRDEKVEIRAMCEDDDGLVRRAAVDRDLNEFTARVVADTRERDRRRVRLVPEAGSERAHGDRREVPDLEL